MPTPIIELQRRLTLVGAIRAGAERPSDGKRPGKRLECFRLTSPRQALIEQAAELYGGAVSSWRSPVGDEWQVYTDAPEIPVLVMPGYSLRQSYELWEGATKRTRLCDGIDEELTSGPCLCAGEGVDRCDLYTRLVVALPELETVLGWRLITKGANAGHELPTMMQLIEAKASGQTFVPARLRLDERRGVKDGQVVRYVVPSLDLGIAYVTLAGGRVDRALPPAGSTADGLGYTPTTPRTFAVETALESVAAPLAAPRGPASDRTAPLPPAATRHRPAPLAESDEAPPEVVGSRETSTGTAGSVSDGRPVEHASAQTSDATRTGGDVPALPAHEQQHLDDAKQQLGATDVTGTPAALLSDAQAKKLNVLVGKLRDGGHVSTPQLWKAIGGLRKMDAPLMVELLDGRDAEGVLHWAPLRNSLTPHEASTLIDWLVRKEQQVAEAAKQGASA